MMFDESPLTSNEYEQVSSLHPVLESVARSMRRHLPPDEGLSAGYSGLTKAVREFDTSRGTSLEEYASLCSLNAIRAEADRENRRRSKTRQMKFDPADHSVLVDPRYEAIAELPDHLQDFLWTYLDVGSIDQTSKALGLKQSVGRARFRQAQKLLQSNAGNAHRTINY